mgnify:CR=1 FL=1
MNILYCGDSKMADGLIISALSLRRQTNAPLNIYVLTAQINTDQQQFQALPAAVTSLLAEELQRLNVQSHVYRYDLTQQFYDDAPLANMGTIFTPYCMLRLYADLIPDLPERLLYLDTDVIASQDPSAFYKQDISKHELIGVLDYYGRWFFHDRVQFADYLNSGVLLLNMAKIKRTQLFARARAMCRDKKMFMPDQSALNKLAKTKAIAPRRYNDQRRRHPDTVFQHFTTSFRFWPWLHTVTVKPWEVDRVHDELHLNQYDDVLNEYSRLRPVLAGLE